MSVEKTKHKNKFIVKIEMQSCKGCSLCIVNCPKKNLKLSEKINRLGYKYCEVIDENNCNGCGVCYLMCPEYCIEIFKE
ncbi:MAG: ferredoxin family protein [Endomicrobiia bacterium]